jgi:hypothetical protein
LGRVASLESPSTRLDREREDHMSRPKAEPTEQRPLSWDPPRRVDILSIPLTSSEYESLRQIGADPDADVAAAIAS